MSLFTSPLEGRLWLATAAVVAAIYASLGRAPVWANSLRASGVIEAFFFAGFVLSILAVLFVALSVRPGVRQFGVALAVMAVYAAAFARIQILEERSHLFEFGLVAVLIYLAATERKANGGRMFMPAATAVVATAAVGWIDEGIQAVLPNRVYDLRDVGLNALAGLLAVGATIALRWARTSR